jgi:excisionase family DNA binding protein
MDDTSSNSPVCLCKKEHTAQEIPELVEQRDWLSPEQVAELLGIGRTFTYALLKGDPSPAIPSYKIGRLRRVRRADVEAYMDRQRCQPPQVGMRGEVSELGGATEGTVAGRGV